MEDTGRATGRKPFSPAEAAQVRAQLDRILASPRFASTSRRATLLRYLVERTLAGEAEQISEYGIGLDVFARPATFDPLNESVVRTEIGRLRQRLREYYATEGAQDCLIIHLPPRSYVARFEMREREHKTQPAARSRLYPRVAITAASLLLALAALWWIRGQAVQSASNPLQGGALVNGFCGFGNCAKPGLVPLGGSAVNPFDFTFTMANSDRYRIQGRFLSTNTAGLNTYAPFTVTYLGNKAGTPSGADVLTVDLLQDFENALPDTASSGYVEGLMGSFGGSLATASGIQGATIFNGKSLPVLGPFLMPERFRYNLDHLSLPALGNPVRKSLRRIFTFGAGSAAGAVIRNAIQ